jgi:predicted metal-dependent HD superfamily phosphohydrolase
MQSDVSSFMKVISMFTHSQENQGWLREKWLALVTSVSADRAKSDAVWDELIRHYSEPHRTYHNLSHIMMLLHYAESHRHEISRLETVEFAIWFHDVIYDPRLKDNERRSAAWAQRAMLAMQIDEHHIAPVMECILATQRHEITSHLTDLPLFLDMDLSILGAKEEIYKAYSEVIHAEYNWMPVEEYRAGRGKFLQGLLDRPALFLTPVMAANLEQQARRNIESELLELAAIH